MSYKIEITFKNSNKVERYKFDSLLKWQEFIFSKDILELENIDSIDIYDAY